MSAGPASKFWRKPSFLHDDLHLEWQFDQNQEWSAKRNVANSLPTGNFFKSSNFEIYPQTICIRGKFSGLFDMKCTTVQGVNV